MKNKYSKGYTLMELVVYASLVALMSVFVVDAILSFSKIFRDIRATRDIQNSALIALDRIDKATRSADAIGSGSEFGTSTGKLVLNYSGVSTTTLEFTVASSTLILKENGTETGPLTGANIFVETFKLELATSTKSSIIRTTLTLKDKRVPINPKRATFYSASVIRTGY